jgi:hypothetical protein
MASGKQAPPPHPIGILEAALKRAGNNGCKDDAAEDQGNCCDEDNRGGTIKDACEGDLKSKNQERPHVKGARKAKDGSSCLEANNLMIQRADSLDLGIQ